MATLPDEIKIFIVKALARYDTPARVAYAVNETFGVAITRQQVHRFDPNCAQPPARRWIELHAATRQAYLRQVAEVGTVQKAVRLAMLDRMVQYAMQSDVKLAASLLVQVAKECGGVYERRNAMPAAIVLPEPPTVPAASPEPPIADETPSIQDDAPPLAAAPEASIPRAPQGSSMTGDADRAARMEAAPDNTPPRAGIRIPGSGEGPRIGAEVPNAFDDRRAAVAGGTLSSRLAQPAASIRKSPEALAVAT